MKERPSVSWSNPVAVSLPVSIRTPRERDGWARAARGARRAAAFIRSQRTNPAMRDVRERWAANLEREARAIESKLATYTGPEKKRLSFKGHGGPVAVGIERSSE